ncbi:MAG: penicillin-binding protein 2 [Candidatus Marinimicrobia bacterium]|nr:penicillin-binding protein 2 [Candidatus Neomarinimicrobiota bacterium]
MLKSNIHITPFRRNMVYGIVIFLFAIIVSKLFYLMIFQHDKYSQLADYNRIRPVLVNAPRGHIFDRNGVLIAANQSVYSVSVVRDEMRNEDDELNLLAEYIGIKREIINLNMKKYYRGRFLPATIARDVSIKNLSLIEEHRGDLPGVNYSEFPIRLYMDKPGPQLSHVLGYLREIGRNELEKYANSDYTPGDFIGAQGLEKQYEWRLKGLKGNLYYQVDALGREVGLVMDKAPIPSTPGEDLTITIDLGLQGYAEELLEGEIGSTVMMNASTGEVLAMVSKPDYVLDDFAGFIDERSWGEYVSDTTKPLLNRATLGLYPPGSAYKIITTIAGLEEYKVDPLWTVECSGIYQYGDRSFGCWKPEGHGTVNLSKGLVESCNIYFYHLIQRMELDVWYKYGRMFGFDEKTGIDLPEEYSGIIPDRKYMDNKYGKRRWTRGFLLNVAIGQGDILVTPLQMVRFISMIATRGKYIQPWLVELSQLSEEEKRDKRVKLNKSTWDKIHKMTFDVVNAFNGTAYSSRISEKKIKFYGKTGTAENPHGKPHAWFVGFAIYRSEIVSISVIIENGGHGGATAAPIASKLIQYWFGFGEEVLTLQ